MPTVLDSEVRPEYVRKLKRVEKERIAWIGTVEDMRMRYGLK